MRRFLAVILSLAATAAVAAEDPRVSFLRQQLLTAKDPRVRAQTVLLLGQTTSEAAVEPLCGSLGDPDSLVRAAAANALGELRLDAAGRCLRTALGEPDGAVRGEVERAIARGTLARGGLYVSVEPVQDRVGGLPEALVQLADKMLRERLATTFAASLAPPSEDRRAATALVKARALKAFQLRLQLLPGATERGLKVELLIMSYPEQALKGTWNVKAAGGKPESLIKAMVPRVLDDAATDLEWKP